MVELAGPAPPTPLLPEPLFHSHSDNPEREGRQLKACTGREAGASDVEVDDASGRAGDARRKAKSSLRREEKQV